MVDLRVVVLDDGLIRVRFEGICGSPVVCGICVRKAPQVSGKSSSLVLGFLSKEFTTFSVSNSYHCITVQL